MARSAGTRYPRGGSELWQGSDPGPTLLRSEFFGVEPTGGTGLIKVWSGAAWVVKPLKVWDGSAWVTKPLKFWNGSAWQLSGG